jgi:hypothetical protein
MRLARCLVLLVGLGALGCADRTLSRPEVEQHKVETHTFGVRTPVLVDLLFVIDNSPAMAAHQANLLTNYRTFIGALGRLGFLPDLHIGVITSDLGTRGASDSHSGASSGACIGDGDGGVLRHASSVNGAFISDHERYDGSRVRNYTGELADAFTELANVGANGCPFSQPLEAVRTALDHNPANAGFLRDEANLAIVFITAQDDCTFEHSSFVVGDSAVDTFRCFTNGVACSDPYTCQPRSDSELMPDVTRYATFLKGLKADPSDVMVGVIAGPPTPVEIRPVVTGTPSLAPSCTFENSLATPGVRLKSFVDQFPNRGQMTAICQGDLEEGLVLSSCVIGAGGRYLGSPCIDGDLADSDLARPGLQPECTVSDVQQSFGGDRREQVLPACDSTASQVPCWHVVTNDQRCTSGPGLEMRVERDDFPPPETWVISSCVTR